MDKPLFKLIIFIVLVGGAAGAFFAVKSRGQTSPPKNIPDLLAAVPLISTTTSDAKLESPDGLKTLILKEEKGINETTYTVSVSDPSGAQNVIFTKTLDSGSTLSIPYNTFSPDNKYIFLKEDNNGATSYIVMATSGAPVGSSQTLEIAGLFSQKEPNYKIADVTGWAAPTLVIVNATKKDSGSIQSFWFEVSNQSFIPLSNYFH